MALLSLENVVKKMEAGTYRAEPHLWFRDVLGLEVENFQMAYLRSLFNLKDNKDFSEYQTLSSLSRDESVEYGALASCYFFGNFAPSKTVLCGDRQLSIAIYQKITYLIEASPLLASMVKMTSKDTHVRDYEDWFILRMGNDKNPQLLEGLMGPDEGRNLFFIVCGKNQQFDRNIVNIARSSMTHDDNYLLVIAPGEQERIVNVT